MVSSEQLYHVLFFSLAVYPTIFMFFERYLWRDISNDHDEHWISSSIIGAYVFDLITYYLLKRELTTFQNSVIYYFRDAVLSFQTATCVFAAIRQIVLSHPQEDTEKDGNILTGWLLMFMTITAYNLLKLHQNKKEVNNYISVAS